MFQQDNAPCLTAKKVKQWMADNSIRVLSWPAQSPNLNPLENLWNRIGVLISKDKRTSKIKLMELIVQSWLRVVMPEELKTPIDSMPRCCRAVIENDGWPTTY